MRKKISHVGSIAGIEGGVKRAGKKAAFSPVMEALTRVGYGVRGLIYIMMGILALSFTLGKGGAPVDPKGAIAAIGQSPVGMVLLWVVLIGLVSYALWGVIRAIFDPLQKGNDAKGLITRAGFLFSAAGYAILVPYTYGLISGAGSSQNGAGTQQSMASIMSTPWGQVVIGIVGLAVIAVGLYQMYTGFNSSFDKQYQTYAMTAEEVKVATQLGRFGTAARGFVFGLVGILVCTAAFQSNPSQPVGFDAALSSLMHQPYGVVLLGIVAVGLMAFGLYSMLSAVWFRAKNRA
jgi:Domain of Unknown Function (DUF1206).